MSGRTPNFITTEDVVIKFGAYDTKTLPKGAFVKPLDLSYVPKHILEDKKWVDFNKNYDIFVYCRYGIVAISAKIVKESI